MKIQLQLSGEKYDSVRAELEKAGFEIAPDADFVLSERDSFPDTLWGKSKDGYHVIRTDEILYIESFGHDITVHAKDGDFAANQPLYKLEALLDGAKFLRISASVIVSRSAIKRIGVSLGRKFTLTLEGCAKAYVTRNYYEKFKEWMGF